MTATASIREGQPAVARAYQYKHGDRPLEGYTIQRGAGRGGFGEVYYAVSDSGREVALKVIHTYEQIEMRGVSQCMNLKSPHLVTIFDVKYGEDGRPWVIMEFVSGPSLRELLDAAPSGLGTQKAAFFLREIGKGLTYLHDCGIVHRDLKPANIFYENGYVKIGDYGLSKAITTSQHSGQTVTVGTVHYMAPEVGAGKYDRGIDIYALGALLYELLTGQVPFFGASPAEVLMKHLSTEPDLGGIEEPFRTVIRKAMAKDPAQRYQSVQEMVEAVFGEEHVRNSVSHFSPESLSVVAGHAAQKIGAAANPGSFTPSDVPHPAGQQPGDQWKDFAGRFEQMGARWSRFGEEFAAKHAWCGPMGRRGKRGAPLWGAADAVADPMPVSQRAMLAGLTIVLSAFAGGLLGDSPRAATVALLSIMGATIGAALARTFIVPTLRYESLWVTRLAVGGFCAIPAVLLSLPGWAGAGAAHQLGGTLVAVIAGLLMLHWEERISPSRGERVSIGNLFTAALLGVILASMFHGSQGLSAIVLAGTSLAVSLSCAWIPRPAGSPTNGVVAGGAPPASPAPAAACINPGRNEPAAAVAGTLPPLAAMLGPARPVPRLARPFWLVLFVGFTTLGLMLWAMLATMHTNPDEGASLFAFGLGSLCAGALSFKRSSQRFFTGYWEYLIRPVVQLACLQSIVAALSMAVFGDVHPNDMPPVVFFTVFPAIVFFVVTFIIGRGGNMTQAVIPPNSSIVLPAHGEPFSFAGFVFGLSRFAATIIGSIVLLFGLLTALAVVGDVPGLLASGVIDPDLPHELNRAFDTTTWPHLMREAGGAVSFIAALIGTGLLLLARRKWGAPHMFRVLLATGLLFAAVIALGKGLPGWSAVRVSGSPGDTIGGYVQMIQTPHLLQAAGLVVFSVFLFLWPPRKASAAAPVAYQQQQQQQQ